MNDLAGALLGLRCFLFHGNRGFRVDTGACGLPSEAAAPQLAGIFMITEFDRMPGLAQGEGGYV